MSPPLPAGALDGVLVVMSAAGASCDTVCGEQGARCSAAHLPTLNSCDRLREVLNCEAGCMEEAHEGERGSAAQWARGLACQSRTLINHTTPEPKF
jgi:hypothetical protein